MTPSSFHPRLTFDSPEVRLLHVPAADPGTLVVTFSALTQKDFDPPVGFAQSFLAKCGISALHFVAARPHWWQVPQMDAALEAASRIAAGYGQVTTYGSSMGAFGALMFSRRLGARTVIAAAPQASINPLKVPFEARWLQHAAQLTFLHDDMAAGLAPAARKFVIYDPCSSDTRHVDLLPPQGVERIQIPLCGHAPLAFLNHAGLLSSTIQAMIRGDLDVGALRETVRARRRGIADYWSELALAFQRRHNLAGTERALRQACTLAPQQLNPKLRLAKLLARLGRMEDGLALIDEALLLRPRHEGARKIRETLVGRAIEQAGDDREALDRLRQRYGARLTTLPPANGHDDGTDDAGG